MTEIRNKMNRSKGEIMNQLEVLRESLGQCDEIILDALLMRNRIVEDHHGIQGST